MISGITALVVEDEYLIALEVQRILEGAGATAVIAHPSIAGTIAPEQHATFDLAVVAVPPRNPVMAALCTSFRNRGVAVVALTSGGENTADSPELADFDVVEKPFSDHELLDAVTAALQGRRACPAS